jgi:hypothetical protein
MALPIVEKPTFTTTKDKGRTMEVSTFDTVTTACYLDDYQVNEYCAQFFGWRYDRYEDKYTDSKGRERSLWFEAWLNPKGKGTYHNGLDDIKPPQFRTRKWGEVLAYCMEQGWKPEMIEQVDERDGKTKYALKLAGIEALKSYPATTHKGDAICRSFLAAAWTLQEMEAPHGS